MRLSCFIVPPRSVCAPSRGARSLRPRAAVSVSWFVRNSAVASNLNRMTPRRKRSLNLSCLTLICPFGPFPATPISLDFQSPLRSQSCSGDQLRMFHDMRSPTDTAPSATTGAAATLDKAAQHVRCPLGIIRCLWLKSCTALLRCDCKIRCSQAEELVCHGQRNPPSLEDSWLGV